MGLKIIRESPWKNSQGLCTGASGLAGEVLREGPHVTVLSAVSTRFPVAAEPGSAQGRGGGERGPRDRAWPETPVNYLFVYLLFIRLVSSFIVSLQLQSPNLAWPEEMTCARVCISCGRRSRDGLEWEVLLELERKG